MNRSRRPARLLCEARRERGAGPHISSRADCQARPQRYAARFRPGSAQRTPSSIWCARSISTGTAGPSRSNPSPTVLRLQEPRVDALQHHGQLEAAERHVVADARDVPAGQLGVPGRELRRRCRSRAAPSRPPRRSTRQPLARRPGRPSRSGSGPGRPAGRRAWTSPSPRRPRWPGWAPSVTSVLSSRKSPCTSVPSGRRRQPGGQPLDQARRSRASPGSPTAPTAAASGRAGGPGSRPGGRSPASPAAVDVDAVDAGQHHRQRLRQLPGLLRGQLRAVLRGSAAPAPSTNRIR